MLCSPCAEYGAERKACGLSGGEAPQGGAGEIEKAALGSSGSFVASDPFDSAASPNTAASDRLPTSRPTVCARFDGLGADGAPARLGIMGGTFDPIHIGHLACAEQAREAYALDAVVFVPAGVPVFKKDQRVTAAADRLAMCRLAVEGNTAFDASAIEIERGGDTYTVDTLRQLRAHYPDNVELYFITGADAVRSIVEWKESAQIARLVRFIAVTRPGFDLNAARQSLAAALEGFSIDYLEATSLAVSSSDLRSRVASGRSIRYLTMDVVRRYIEKHGLYREGVR